MKLGSGMAAGRWNLEFNFWGLGSKSTRERACSGIWTTTHFGLGLWYLWQVFQSNKAHATNAYKWLGFAPMMPSLRSRVLPISMIYWLPLGVIPSDALNLPLFHFDPNPINPRASEPFTSREDCLLLLPRVPPSKPIEKNLEVENFFSQGFERCHLVGNPKPRGWEAIPHWGKCYLQ